MARKEGLHHTLHLSVCFGGEERLLVDTVSKSGNQETARVHLHGLGLVHFAIITFQ